MDRALLLGEKGESLNRLPIGKALIPFASGQKDEDDEGLNLATADPN